MFLYKKKVYLHRLLEKTNTYIIMPTTTSTNLLANTLSHIINSLLTLFSDDAPADDSDAWEDVLDDDLDDIDEDFDAEDEENGVNFDSKSTEEVDEDDDLDLGAFDDDEEDEDPDYYEEYDEL